MLQTFLLALRNLRRNSRRTMFTVAAIGVGLAMMVFSITFATGSYDQMIRKGVSQLAGHVVVQHPDFQTTKDNALFVSDSGSVAKALQATFPNAVITQRILHTGLLTSATGSVGAAFSGCEPQREAEVSELDDKLVEGSWLADDDPRGIVIGTGMAERLDVTIGDKLVYMGQQEGQDEIQSRLFRLRGVFQTHSPEADGFVAVIHLDAAREVLTADGVAGQVAVHLPVSEVVPGVEHVARAAVDRQDVVVLNWKQALPDLFALIQVDKRSNDIIMAIIGIIVALGILNTVLMSVLERTREFGVLMAIGMRPRAVMTLVILEGAAMGVVGAILGLALGFLPSWYTVHHGIDMRGYVGETMDNGGISISGLIFGAWDVPRLMQYAGATVLMAVGASAWPAWRVSRLQPVDAMRSK